MEKILFINACVRSNGRTLELARLVLEQLNGEVEEVNLEHEAIQPHTWEKLLRRDELLAAGDFTDPMFRFARQFREADTIVIAAPYYDLSFPSSLKNYLEAVANVGLTFYYDKNELPQTLCRAKRFYYISTSGAQFLPTYGYEYVKALFREFYHIEEGHCFFAEKLDLRDSDPDSIMKIAKNDILNHFG